MLEWREWKYVREWLLLYALGAAAAGRCRCCWARHRRRHYCHFLPHHLSVRRSLWDV